MNTYMHFRWSCAPKAKVGYRVNFITKLSVSKPSTSRSEEPFDTKETMRRWFLQTLDILAPVAWHHCRVGLPNGWLSVRSSAPLLLLFARYSTISLIHWFWTLKGKLPALNVFLPNDFYLLDSRLSIPTGALYKALYKILDLVFLLALYIKA